MLFSEEEAELLRRRGRAAQQRGLKACATAANPFLNAG